MSRLLDLVAIAPGMLLPTAADLGEDPAGFMFCDGRELNIADQPALYESIGDKFNTTGDGVITFNIPDMRGRSPIGAGQGASLTERLLGDNGGEEEHTLTTEEMPEHNHDHSRPTSWGSDQGPGASIGWSRDNGVGANSNQPTANAGGGQAHNNMPPFLVLNWLIKL